MRVAAAKSYWGEENFRSVSSITLVEDFAASIFLGGAEVDSAIPNIGKEKTKGLFMAASRSSRSIRFLSSLARILFFISIN